MGRNWGAKPKMAHKGGSNVKQFSPKRSPSVYGTNGVDVVLRLENSIFVQIVYYLTSREGQMRSARQHASLPALRFFGFYVRSGKPLLASNDAEERNTLNQTPPLLGVSG